MTPVVGRLLAFTTPAAAVVAIAASGTASSTGCTTQQCAPGSICVVSQIGHTDSSTCGLNPTFTLPGDFVYRAGDELVWETAPIEGPWLGFNGMETITFFYPPEMLEALAPNGYPTSVTALVSSAPRDSGLSWPAFTGAVGQLAEVTYISPIAVNVMNASCADYTVHVEIRAFAPLTGATDASTPDDAPADAPLATTDGNAPDP